MKVCIERILGSFYVNGTRFDLTENEYRNSLRVQTDTQVFMQVDKSFGDNPVFDGFKQELGSFHRCGALVFEGSGESFYFDGVSESEYMLTLFAELVRKRLIKLESV